MFKVKSDLFIILRSKTNLRLINQTNHKIEYLIKMNFMRDIHMKLRMKKYFKIKSSNGISMKKDTYLGVLGNLIIVMKMPIYILKYFRKYLKIRAVLLTEINSIKKR